MRVVIREYLNGHSDEEVIYLFKKGYFCFQEHLNGFAQQVFQNKAGMWTQIYK